MVRFFLALASVVPALASAQVADTTPVPRDLFAAYQTRFVGMDGGQPVFVVGKLQSPDVEPLIPAGATVLGGIVVRRNSGAIRTASAALMMPGEAREARQRAIEHLKSVGYRQAEPFGEPKEGFVSTMPIGGFDHYCGDSTSVFVTSQNRAEGGAYVILQIDRIRQSSGSICGQSSHATVVGRAPMSAELRFPVLEAPEGVVGLHTGGGGWGSNTKTRYITAELESNLSAEAIVDHYTREFTKSGWKATKRLKHEETIIQLLRDESGGTSREVVLSNIRLKDGNHNVTAQIYALTKGTP